MLADSMSAKVHDRSVWQAGQLSWRGWRLVGGEGSAVVVSSRGARVKRVVRRYMMGVGACTAETNG